MELKLGRRCQKSIFNTLGWEELDGSYKLDHPVVICFGGNGVNNERKANGFAKLISSNLGIRTGERDNEVGLGIEQGDFPADILSVVYDGKYDDNSYSLQQLDYENGLTEKPLDSPQDARDYTEVKSSIKDFFDKYFKSLFLDADGNRLDVTAAMKNMRNVNIVSFCYGTFVTSQIENIMAEEMMRAGYREDEIKMVQSQLFSIKASPIIRLGASKSTSIAFTSLDDYDSEYSRYKDGELTNPELHMADLQDGVGATVSYSPNEVAYAVPSLTDYDDSHESKAYFSMSRRRAQEFRSTDFGDSLPAFLTMVLNDAVNNSISNTKLSEFIQIASAGESIEKINALLQRFNGHSYPQVMREIYEETETMNIEYVGSVSKEEIENNKAYGRCLREYGMMSDTIKRLATTILGSMDKITFLSNQLMENEFEGKTVVKSELVHLLSELKEVMQTRAALDKEERLNEEEIENIESLTEKLSCIKDEIEFMKVKKEAWTQLNTTCSQMCDFCKQVMMVLVDEKDKDTVERLGGSFGEDGIARGGYFGNGVEYTRKVFREKFPEIAEKLVPSSLKLEPEKREIGIED